MALLFLCWPSSVTSARAATSCTATHASTVSFGSISVLGGADAEVTYSFTFNCSGSTPGSTMAACIKPVSSTGGSDGSTGPHHMVDGSNVLRYRVYSDPSFSQPFTLNTYEHNGFTADSSGNSSTVVYAYFKIPAGQSSTAAGTYRDDLSWSTVASDDSELSSLCAGTAVEQSFDLSVEASNPPQCSVTGGNLNFGSVGTLTSNVDAATTIEATCTNGTSYTVGLNGGRNGGTNASNRKMMNGTETITYGLYQDASRSNGWFGDAAAVSGTGSSQSFSVYGRVPPQSTPSPQSYSDTVVITVNF